MTRRTDPLLALVESYINEHLRRVRGASAHTVREADASGPARKAA